MCFLSLTMSCYSISHGAKGILFVRLRFSSLFQEYSLQSQREDDFINKQSIRYFEFTPLGESIQAGTSRLSIPYVKFKVMDYNILAQTHMMTHIRNYQRCPRQCLNWSYRKNILRDEFLAESPDIFCLQEVEGSHRTDLLQPWREKGYDALYVARGPDKPDGCALLYKTSLFRMVDFVPVHFLKNEVPLLDRPNVGLVARLEVKSHPGNYVVVANTHLLYNPRRVDIKLCQLQILLAETERLAYAGGNKYHPVVLTGDLNVNANSGLISLLRNGRLDCQELVSKRWRPVTDIHGHKVKVPAELLQTHLNISTCCRFMDTQAARQKGQPDPRQTKNLEEVLLQHRVCPSISLDVSVDQQKEAEKPISSTYKNETVPQHWPRMSDIKGKELRHGFPLSDIFSHPDLDKPARWYRSVPNHEKKLNVYDYMFYSSDEKSHKIQVGQLRLLSRLRMPSVTEYQSRLQSLPNFACGSDHLPLVANFLLPVR